MSGSLVFRRGVGTQMLIVSSSTTAAKSVVARIFPASTKGFRTVVEAGKIRATTDFAAVAELDTINICVPTPLRKTKDPDMSYIVNSCEEIARPFHAGILMILESTTYPGTTDELMLPMFEAGGL